MIGVTYHQTIQEHNLFIYYQITFVKQIIIVDKTMSQHFILELY